MRSGLMLPLAAALLVGGACAGIFSRRQHLAAGDAIPDVEAHDQDGRVVRLPQYRGRPLVVYFYPKDRTSGCTIEAHEFGVEYAKFRDLGAEVLGVSNDDVASHKDFCGQQALPFPLLADPDQVIARAFGVRSTLGFYQRITFVVDSGGVVRRIFESVRPLGHARAVLAAVQELTAGGR